MRAAMKPEHLWDLEPSEDCDHKGFRKIKDERKNPAPDVFKETMVCTNCFQVYSVRVRYDKKLGRHV
jgi:hypothetical protein